MRYSHLLGSTTLSRVAQALSPIRGPAPLRTQVTPESGSFDFHMNTQDRGVILSNPLKIDGKSVLIESGEIDPFSLRRALLFWDKILWPATSGIYIEGGVDIEFLEAEEKLIRPYFRVNGDAATGISMAFSESYRILDNKNPGQWLLSEGEKSLQIHGKLVEEGRGVIARLVNAIPVPDRAMPLEDVILFKEKRGDEVIALRMLLDDFYQAWIRSEDKDHQFMLAIAKIDRASANMLRVARESKLPFRMSSWKINFNASPDIVKAAMGYLTSSQSFELGTVSSLLAGAATSMLSVGTDIGIHKSNNLSPFNYVASMENSLF